MSLQMMKLEPMDDRKPESTRRPSKNTVVHGRWYRQAATKLLRLDLKASMMLCATVGSQTQVQADT